MSDDEALQRRLRAVERSLTDGDHDVDSLRTAGDQADRIDELAARLDEAEDRIAELEASTQALRGYVGNVRSVNGTSNSVPTLRWPASSVSKRGSTTRGDQTLVPSKPPMPLVRQFPVETPDSPGSVPRADSGPTKGWRQTAIPVATATPTKTALTATMATTVATV